MAEPLHYTPSRRPPPDPAREELDHFLQLLHERGVLRFANDALETAPEWLEMVAQGLNRSESLNALQNLSLVLLALGRMSPDRLDVILRAAASGMEAAEADQRRQPPPGVTGLFRLLHDRDLWEGLGPLLEGLTRLGQALGEEPESPAARRAGERG